MAGNAKMSLRTPNEWHQHSAMNMSSAQTSQVKAREQCDTSRRAHQDCLAANLQAYNDLHQSLDDKVRASQRLVDKLENRARSVENSVQNTKQSLAQVEAAHRAKEAPLNLCTWRIDQREKRPLREQVRDPPEIALEEERTALMEGQRKLSEGGKRTKAMISQLEDALVDLQADINDKRQALAVDDMCHRTTHRLWQTQIDRPSGVPPSGRPSSLRGASMTMPVASRQIHADESGRNESNRQTAAQRHSHAAASKEQEAKALREENIRLIDRCEKIAIQTASKTNHALQERINENQQMRRGLESQVRETKGKIDHTKQTISETKQQIKSLEEPTALLATRDSWRKQRALREQISDPVSTRLEEHKLILIQTNEALRQHRMEEKNALTDLHHNMERLLTDLRDKTAALHIDLNCISHESLNWHGKPTKNINKVMLNKALKVDPSFTPGGLGSTKYTPMSARF